ncbi:MAG: carboxypeptidase regulatory-like domain-containing protein [Candidatus Sericytochromatia bacterium]|nr:carboxypeptidase regulatory-like domain-containing protein [Candidatus Sericytochromatia bacterium]
MRTRLSLGSLGLAVLFGALACAPKPSEPSVPAASVARVVKRPDLKAKPQLGDEATLSQVQGSGRVQVAFEGLDPSADDAAGLVSNAGASLVGVDPGGLLSKTKPYRLAQSTRDIARVTLTLTGPGGYRQVQSLTRAEMLQPLVASYFANVPVGNATLAVRVLDAAGAEIGAAQQAFVVAKGILTRVPLAVTLGRRPAVAGKPGETGGVAAVVSFQSATQERFNITGYWFVSGEGQAPAYPMQGCGQGYVWFVSQVGQQVYARVSGYNDSAARLWPNTYWEEEVRGVLDGARLLARGQVRYVDEAGLAPTRTEDSFYVLTYDPDKIRMTGTRNGLGGWAVPYRFLPNCGETPPPILPVAALRPTTPPSWLPTTPPSGVPVAAPSPRVVQGRVFDHDGRPLAGARVSLASLETSWLRVTTTSADGSYTLGPLTDVPAEPGLEMLAEAEGRTSPFHYVRTDDMLDGDARSLWLSPPGFPHAGCYRPRPWLPRPASCATAGPTSPPLPAPSATPAALSTPTAPPRPSATPAPATPLPSATPTPGPTPTIAGR